MLSTTEGSYNTSVGINALEHNIIGDYNVAVGTSAGNLGTSDGHNISIGFNARIAAGVSNSVVIGDNAYTNTNQLALLGNATTKYCGGYANWTNYASDARLKTDVNEAVGGLAFIMRLRPVTYHVDVRGIYAMQGISAYEQNDAAVTAKMKSETDEAIRSKGAVRMSGFIAQEVEKAAKETGYDFDGVKKPANEMDNYGLTYSTFVVPLVKAVQEQQQLINSLEQRLIAVEAQNKLLLQLLNKK